MRLASSKRSKRLSTVTVISIFGVAFGVLALTAVLGVTGGFQQAFQEKILGIYPHMVVLNRSGELTDYDGTIARLIDIPGVTGASAATYDDMMIAAGMNRAGTIVKGIDLNTVQTVIPIADLMQQGELKALEEDVAFTPSENRMETSGFFTQTWNTVIAFPDGRLQNFQTPPSRTHKGKAHVKVLDLRSGRSTTDPEHFNVRLATPAIAHDTPPISFTAVRHGALSEPRHLAAGKYLMDGHEAPLLLTSDAHVLIVLAPSGKPDDTVILTDPQVDPIPEGHSMVRLVHLGMNDANHSPSITLADQSGQALASFDANGRPDAFTPVPGRLPGIILGVDLAERLNVGPGDEISLVTPLRGVDRSMLGERITAPSSVRHTVTGIFQSGFYEYDVRLAIVNLNAAQRFLNRGQVARWIEVRTDKLLNIAETKRRVAASLDPYGLHTLGEHAASLKKRYQRLARGEAGTKALASPTGLVDHVSNVMDSIQLLKFQELDFGYRPQFRLIDWQEMNANLLSALKLQKVVLTIFFLIIIVVGSFVVVGSQIMVVHEKTPDIAILKTMGCDDSMIRTVFTLQGLLVAGIGTAVGLVMGAILVGLMGWVDYQLDASVYLIDHLPVSLDAWDLLLIAGATGLCTTIATQYSAARAASKTIVDGLRSLD